MFIGDVTDDAFVDEIIKRSTVVVACLAPYTEVSKLDKSFHGIHLTKLRPHKKQLHKSDDPTFFCLYKVSSKLIEGCIANGTHYCDLTGETLWIKEMIDKYHEKV